MSRHRKGRRHRKVNMTPRPVGRAGSPRAVPQATSGRERPVIVREEEPTIGKNDRATPAVPVTPARDVAPGRERDVAPSPEQDVAPSPEQDGAPIPGQSKGDEEQPAVLIRVRESGLSRHAVRTWEQLASAGADGSALDALCAAVGFQEATVLRHLKGLADQGLVVRDESLWRAIGASRTPGAREREEAGEPLVP